MNGYRLAGQLLQAAVLGTLLAIALAKFFVSASGIAVFKYQGF